MTTIRTDIAEAITDSDYAYVANKLDDLKGSYAALYVLQACIDAGATPSEALEGLRRAINLGSK